MVLCSPKPVPTADVSPPSGSMPGDIDETSHLPCNGMARSMEGVASRQWEVVAERPGKGVACAGE
jgi:hypothetical protein